MSAALKPQQRISTWLASGVLLLAAWPVFSNFLSFLPNIQWVLQDNWSSDPVEILNRVFWIGTALLEPVMILATALLAWVGRNRILRAFPTALYVLGFLISFLLLLVLQFRGALYGETTAWDLLVGPTPQSFFYVGSIVLAFAAAILELTNKAPFAAQAVAAAGRGNPVAFDTATGQPIYGYDTNTGAPIF